MQTFIPHYTFEKCAECLDDKRLYKQIVECKQIQQSLFKIRLLKDLCSLNGSDKEYYITQRKQIPWANHPIVKMWEGYELALRDYQQVMLQTWLDKRWNTPKMLNIFTIHSTGLEYGDLPHWWDDYCVHQSHKAMLWKKDTEHYKQFEDDGREYEQKYGKIEYYWIKE